MENTASRIAVMLSLEGIPDKQHAKYLETRCGIPEFNAFRLLRRGDPVLPATLKALSIGLNVSEGWLEQGQVDSNRLHDLEVFLFCRGLDIAEAPSLFRLQQDFLAEDPTAKEYFALYRPGQFNLIAVARLYDDYLKRTRLKLVRPEQVPTEREADLQQFRDALRDLRIIVRKYVSVFRIIAEVILNILLTQITLKGGSGRGNRHSNRNADRGNGLQEPAAVMKGVSMKSPVKNLLPIDSSPANSSSSRESVGVRWMKMESKMVADTIPELKIMQAKDKFFHENVVPIPMGMED